MAVENSRIGDTRLHPDGSGQRQELAAVRGGSKWVTRNEPAREDIVGGGVLVNGWRKDQEKLTPAEIETARKALNIVRTMGGKVKSEHE